MDSTLKPAVTLMSGRLVGVVVAFSIPVVLARVLDQTAFGTYKQLFLVYATLYGIAQLGMAESLFYFLPSNPARAGRYALNSLLALSGAGAACFVLLWENSGLGAFGGFSPAVMGCQADGTFDRVALCPLDHWN